jgi:hypothetical protein
MSSRFPPGAIAFAKDGKRYVVEEVVDGIAYCHSDSGAEAEFSVSQLKTEAEQAAETGGQRELLYARLGQSSVYAPYKGMIDRRDAEHLLARAAWLFPGLLDFAGVHAAEQAFRKMASGRPLPELSIVKCRALFDAAPPETRVNLLAAMVDAAPEKLASAAKVGDNLIRAMIAKGLDAAAFEAFGSRRRQ